MHMVHSIEHSLSIVISGSFRKYYSDIRGMITRFETLGVQVLSPKHSEVVNPGDDFVLLETDESTCLERVERAHLSAIRQADALYLYNPDGYIGLSSAMEIGWALAFGKPVYAKEACEDVTLQYFACKAGTPDEVKACLLGKKGDLGGRLSPQSSLEALQSYVQKVVARRGFDSETPRDKILLMLEEFGELAKAVRKYVGLKIDKDRDEEYSELKYELADILIYLLDLANTCGIDLFDAFQEKERQNRKRQWGNA